MCAKQIFDKYLIETEKNGRVERFKCFPVIQMDFVIRINQKTTAKNGRDWIHSLLQLEPVKEIHAETCNR